MKKVILLLCLLAVLGFSGCFSFRYTAGAPVSDFEGAVDIRYPELDTIEAYARMKGVLAKDYVKESRMSNGAFRLFFSDGSTRVEGRIANNELKDVFRIYYDNGTPYLVAHYEDGELHRSVTTYYENGETQMRISYRNGVLDGDFYLLYPDGTMHINRTYRQGLPSGVAIVYNEDGTELRRINYNN